MSTGPLNDTDPRVEAFLHENLKKISTADKLKQTFKMSHFVWQQAKQAFLKSASTKSPQEQNKLFAEIFFPELAEHFARQKDVIVNTENKLEILEALSPFLKTLEALGIDYQIVGSVASSAYGAARSTRDIDLVCPLDRSKVALLVSALKNEYYIDPDMIHEAINTSGSFNIIHLKTMFKLDVFILKNTPYETESFSRKHPEALGENQDQIQIYLSSPEDVIISKLNWYRLGGEASERQWLDIKTVYQVQLGSLDQGYITKWCQNLGLLDLWEKVKKK